ncbi:hypothetical protein F2Q70_00035195 [Brassica cretica]|uniref:DC1-like C-terminal domain-containing protein n=1 Tax=Brassica cretica TaxID=69181 RepID=A0A8S9JPZ1_BRACR|nr:hypothetical protein F2Q70_00035195 [Brassica cretica]
MPEAPKNESLEVFDLTLDEKNKRRLQLIEELTSNADQVQRRVLEEILTRNADVEYLRRHDLACSDCEVALHVQCALGDFSRLMPGKLYTFGERECEVVLNNLYTRPFCSHCRSRCKAPVILKDNNKDNGYICSKSCL